MAYKPRKRKVKKNVPMGQAYIHSTFNLIISQKMIKLSCFE